MSVIRFGAASIALAVMLPMSSAARVDRSFITNQRFGVPSGRALFRRQILLDHNSVRADAGAPPLVWDDRLATDAAAHARFLARTERFEHAPRLAGRAVQGENLWMGTRYAYSYSTMTEAWTSEARIFRPGRFPNLSRTGSWHDVGHFTQIIWAKTRSVGCAIAANRRDEYLVCRYFPAGNVWGQSPFDRQEIAATSFANASAR